MPIGAPPGPPAGLPAFGGKGGKGIPRPPGGGMKPGPPGPGRPPLAKGGGGMPPVWERS